jgi:hypothetical protein
VGGSGARLPMFARGLARSLLAGAAEVRDHPRPAMGTWGAVARVASIGGDGFCGHRIEGFRVSP